jgi:hypothetical protein
LEGASYVNGCEIGELQFFGYDSSRTGDFGAWAGHWN